MERCLRPLTRRGSTTGPQWPALENLDRAYMRQDVFLHDLMKPIHAFKEMGEKNYHGLEEYLDLLLQTFDIAEDAGMLPIVLH